MRCPYCGSIDDKVVDSRLIKEERAIRRRRECLGCAKRFTTYEYVEDVPLMIIKRDNRREPFDRQKLVNKISLACHKRPIPTSRIDQLVDEIESEISSLDNKEVPSKQVGDLVMKHLQQLDEVAYVRFASVYKNFKDKSEFMEELRQLLE
ncbi:MAG: transcriptional repressor NrdR [Candidatus Latescibacteria bacterium]|nr:transcriptional repressor NrdR [Candidatus Latescibacterota bacterium]